MSAATYLLLAETPLELSAQRESFYAVPATSIAGALRARLQAPCVNAVAQGRIQQDEPVFVAAGTDAGKAPVLVSSGSALAIPMRSFQGLFAYVSSAATLRRFADASGRTFDLHDADPFTARGAKGAEIETKGEVLLEEFRYRFEADDLVTSAAQIVASAANLPSWLRTKVERDLVLVENGNFEFMLRYVCDLVEEAEVGAERRGISRSRKIECLPSETLLWFSLEPNERSPFNELFGEITAWLRTRSGASLQIGGGETKGRGICRLSPFTAESVMETEQAVAS